MADVHAGKAVLQGGAVCAGTVRGQARDTRLQTLRLLLLPVQNDGQACVNCVKGRLY
jgi:hypothetical protein